MTIDPAARREGLSSPLVRCVAAAHTYGAGRNAVTAVHGANCEILPSTRVALTGPSGSGKTTLLHLMAGLEAPTSGSVSWPALGGHPRFRPDRLGVVFQGPSLLPALTAIENVAFPLMLTGQGERSARQAALAALDRLGLVSLADKLPQELSGGQAQRVAVARVLAGSPDLILADEPTGQLDHNAAALVIDVLLETAEACSAGLAVSTHDPRVAARLDQEWSMSDGHLTAVSASTGERWAVR